MTWILRPTKCTALSVACVLLSAVIAFPAGFKAVAVDYPYSTAEPQKFGWPLTEAERAYVLKPEYVRRPGSEHMKHLPKLWPMTPSAGNWGGTAWLDTHAKLVEHTKANQGPIDILLVGDSITQQWGGPLSGPKGELNAAWKKRFGKYKTVNIGIGGDKTQNILWRLDHGGVDGLEPKAIVLLIGNNNMFFTAETGFEAAAEGIKVCVQNLREKFPKVPIITLKVFPAHAPGVPFYEDIRRVNRALDDLKLTEDPGVELLDLTNELTNKDGTLKAELFTADRIHLKQEAGYGLFAEKLKPSLEKVLNK